MIMKPNTLGWLAVAVLLCSCAATSIKRTWKSPEFHGTPVAKAAVITVDERPMLRQGFENRLAAEMRKTGVTASTTYGLLSLPEINQDKRAAAERLRAAGSDAVVVLRLVDVANLMRETRPGPERYADVVTGIEPAYWYDYYTVAFQDMSPTYLSLKQTVCLETAIFDLTTGKRLWS